MNEQDRQPRPMSVRDIRRAQRQRRRRRINAILFMAWLSGVLAPGLVLNKWSVTLTLALIVPVSVIVGVVLGLLVVAALAAVNGPPGRWLAGFAVRDLTSMAALLAGRSRPALRDEWRAHLAGWSGTDPVTSRKVRQAAGFVVSAIHCRLGDAAETAWTPGDAILRSRTLSNLFVLLPTGVAAMIIFRHEGTVGVLTSAESISAIGISLYAFVHVGRKYRDVKPPEPKAGRTKE